MCSVFDGPILSADNASNNFHIGVIYMLVLINIDVCVFDIYEALFDIIRDARDYQGSLGDQWQLKK